MGGVFVQCKDTEEVWVRSSSTEVGEECLAQRYRGRVGEVFVQHEGTGEG